MACHYMCTCSSLDVCIIHMKHIGYWPQALTMGMRMRNEEWRRREVAFRAKSGRSGGSNAMAMIPWRLHSFSASGQVRVQRGPPAAPTVSSVTFKFGKNHMQKPTQTHSRLDREALSTPYSCQAYISGKSPVIHVAPIITFLFWFGECYAYALITVNLNPPTHTQTRTYSE